MSPRSCETCTAFAGERLIATGPISDVAGKVKKHADRNPDAAILIFDDASAEQVELDLRGTFHHDRDDVDRALSALADGTVPWEMLSGETISLEQLPSALAAPNGGPALKWVVDPRR